MNVKVKLTCKYCGNIYKNPISLTCGDNICKHHIEELVSKNPSNKFSCPLCFKENMNQNFSVNKLIQDMLEYDLHKFKIDSKLKKIYENLKLEVEHLEQILNNPDNVIYEQLNELKKQVYLDRDRLKYEIDTLADGLIEQLDKYEKKFKSEYKNNIDLKYYSSLVEFSRAQLVEYEKYLNSFSTKYKERKEISLKKEKLIFNLQSEIAEL